MSIDQIRETFVLEARELLQSMDECLLRMEKAPADKETVDALFRSVHTIKGSGGMLEFDPIVDFAHVVESLLGMIRDGRVPITKDLIALLLSCGDHLGVLVDTVAERGADPDPDVLTRGQAFIERLNVYATAVSDQPVSMQVPKVRNENWHISLRFGRDVLRHGMDPLSVSRYLQTLGEIVSVTSLFDAMPNADQVDAESCYLGLELDFKSDADKQTISEAFEFVRDQCQVRILSPHSRVSDYVDLINALPEDKNRLGELLVESGALTAEELQEGLHIQRCPAGVRFNDCVYKRDGFCDGKQCLSDPTVRRRFAFAGGDVKSRPAPDHVPASEDERREIVNSAPEKQKRGGEQRRQERNFIRIPADKLDLLINLVGELVIASASTALRARQAGNSELVESASLVTRLVDEIRGNSLQLRMVPIGDTFSRFKRVVHDLSRELNKDIEIVVSGADTELDKTVVERISDPLMHLVRNAIDHGIEPADRRVALGKSATGTLKLNAFHDSGIIIIEVSDDGAGLNRETILAHAVERGLVDPEQTLSEDDIYKLIFEPGFSTAEYITSLSGRGVGMDVVRKSVEALRGTIEIETRQGAGTTIRIRLPLTLAIIEGFLMAVGNTSYVVPLDMVVECVELDETHISRGRNYIDLRGEVLPFLRLRDQFQDRSAVARRENIVVVQYAGHKAGLVVDKLMGEFQTVIRPLGKIFDNLPGISGTTILGSGEVALILDVPSLVQHVSKMESLSVRH